MGVTLPTPAGWKIGEDPKVDTLIKVIATIEEELRHNRPLENDLMDTRMGTKRALKVMIKKTCNKEDKDQHNFVSKISTSSMKAASEVMEGCRREGGSPRKPRTKARRMGWPHSRRS